MSGEATQGGPAAPNASFVVPVYNEAETLEGVVREMASRLRAGLGGGPFELLLVENGSTDGSPAIVRRLEAEISEVRGVSLPRPSYGAALRTGILAASAGRVVVFNADFWSLEFARAALSLLGAHHMVVGSKRARGARDERGVLRRAVTAAFNAFLRLAFRFEGTDTHGLKAFRAPDLREIVGSCVTDREVFDTEMILRAQRAGLSVVEVPVAVRESRPTRYGLLKRLPSVVREVASLWWALSRPGPGGRR